MPDCGSQVFLCDVPIRFDTYEGCSHDCKYCFASRKKSINVIKKGEGKESLINFINGKRTIKTNWADWDIPLHWGECQILFNHAKKNMNILMNV